MTLLSRYIENLTGFRPRIKTNLTHLDDMRPEAFKEGSVIRFSKKFENSRKWYNYVAILENHRWYISSANSRSSGYSWQELIEWMQGAGGNISDFMMATNWTRLDFSTRPLTPVIPRELLDIVDKED